MLVRKCLGSSSSDEESIDLRACIDLRALICGGSAVICEPGPEMDRSLKRSISSLDLAPDAGAAQARRSAQPSNQDYLKVFLDPPPPPSRPLPQIDGSTSWNLEVLIQITNRKRAAEEYGRNVDTLAQLVADRKAPEEEPEEFEAPEEEPLPPAKRVEEIRYHWGKSRLHSLFGVGSRTCSRRQGPSRRWIEPL